VISSDRLAKILALLELKRSPQYIDRSSRENDCYSTGFALEGVDYHFIGVSGTTVRCLARDPILQTFQAETQLSLFDVVRSSPTITHYVGQYELKWNSWQSFSREQWHRIKYITLDAYKIRHWLESKWVGRKKLVTVVRYRALKAVWGLQDQDKRNFSSLDILRKVHGKNFFLHPGYERAISRLETVLESLKETGELDKSSDGRFSLTGLGVAAIERIEEEDRKHRDNLRLQRRMLYLTIVVALAALFQAGVVKAPPAREFKKWFWQSEPRSTGVVGRCAGRLSP
jgi:hypothetical protein